MTYTEKDIACCATIRMLDVPDQIILEAIQRVVAYFNSDEYKPSMGTHSKATSAKSKELSPAFLFSGEASFHGGGATSSFWYRLAASAKRSTPCTIGLLQRRRL